MIPLISWDIELDGSFQKQYAIRLLSNSCVCLLLCLIKYVNIESIHISLNFHYLAPPIAVSSLDKVILFLSSINKLSSIMNKYVL